MMVLIINTIIITITADFTMEEYIIAVNFHFFIVASLKIVR